MEEENRTVPLPELPPRCGACGGVQRPAIVWFGEVLPQDIFSAAVDAARSCALFLIVGTSAVVPTRGQPGHDRRRRGRTGVGGESGRYARHGDLPPRLARSGGPRSWRRSSRKPSGWYWEQGAGSRERKMQPKP